METPMTPVSENGTRAHIKQPGCAGPSLVAFGWLWITAIAFGRITYWILRTADGKEIPGISSYTGALVQALLLALLLFPLALRWKQPTYRGVFRAWALASLFLLLGSLPLLTRPYALQLHTVLHTLLALAYTAGVWLFGRGAGRPLGSARPSLGPALGALVLGVVLSYPWLSWGALGSALDTVLQLTAAFSIGLAAAVTLETHLFPALFENERGEPGEVSAGSFLLGGLTTGATLLIFASGTGFGYFIMQLLLMLVLPALGFALFGLVQLGARRGGLGRLLPTAILIGLAAAGPMTLIDPTELLLVISAMPGEILQWALIAAGVSMAIGIVFGGAFLALVLLRSGRRMTYADVEGEARAGTPRAALPGPAPAAIVFLLLGAIIYFRQGQPGFHGDGLFVVMREQIDLSAAAEMEDYDGRRQYIYEALVDHAQRTQAGLRADLERFNVPYTPYYLVNGMEVPGSPMLRLWLATRPEVDRVLRSPSMRPLPAERPIFTFNQPEPPVTPWNIEYINAVRAWEEFEVTGEGIIVGQSDTGAEWDHPELIDNYLGWDAVTQTADHNYHWFDPWYATTSPEDVSSHGTHTLGTILGSATGVAPGARWFGCANLSRNLGNPAFYLDCMQFMLAPFPLGGDPFRDGVPARGAHVINNSWGCPSVEGCDAETLLPAVKALRRAGIFIVVSAGNEGPGCETLNHPPAIYEEVFSVGAIDRAGRLADFSSLGPVTVDGSWRVKPDIVAPGVNIIAPMAGRSYGPLAGTSMAGPHAAGVVALMWSANPGLIGDIERTETILKESAQPFSGTLPNCPGVEGFPSTAVGYGVLDAYEAVKAATNEH